MKTKEVKQIRIQASYEGDVRYNLIVALKDKLNRLHTAYNRVDENIRFMQKDHDVNCDMCGKCCKKDYPLISEVEALYIIWYILNKTNIHIDSIIEKCHSIYNRFKKAYEKAGGDANATQFHINVDNINIAAFPDFFQYTCPFSQYKACMIHPARPFMCRQFGYRKHTDGSYMMCEHYCRQYDNSARRDSVVTEHGRIEKTIQSLQFPIADIERTSILHEVIGTPHKDRPTTPIPRGHLFTMLIRVYQKLISGNIV